MIMSNASAEDPGVLDSIDARLLGTITGGAEAAGKSWTDELLHFDSINYGVGAATALAIGPLLKHTLWKAAMIGLGRGRGAPPG
jgi:hypothetical protein